MSYWQYPDFCQLYTYVYFQDFSCICSLVQYAYLSRMGKCNRENHGNLPFFCVGNNAVCGNGRSNSDIFEICNKSFKETCREEAVPYMELQSVHTRGSAVFSVCIKLWDQLPQRIIFRRFRYTDGKIFNGRTKDGLPVADRRSE